MQLPGKWRLSEPEMATPVAGGLQAKAGLWSFYELNMQMNAGFYGQGVSKHVLEYLKKWSKICPKHLRNYPLKMR